MALAYPRFYQGTGDLEPAASAHGNKVTKIINYKYFSIFYLFSHYFLLL